MKKSRVLYYEKHQKKMVLIQFDPVLDEIRAEGNSLFL